MRMIDHIKLVDFIRSNTKNNTCLKTDTELRDEFVEMVDDSSISVQVVGNARRRIKVGIKREPQVKGLRSNRSEIILNKLDYLIKLLAPLTSDANLNGKE